MNNKKLSIFVGKHSLSRQKSLAAHRHADHSLVILREVAESTTRYR